MIAQEKPMDMRPLDYGGLLDRTLELYSNNLGLFISIAALVYVPLFAANLFLMYSSAQGGASVAELGILIAIANALGSFLVTGMLTVAVSNRYLGKQATIGQCFQEVVPLLMPLILTSILSGLLIFLGLFLFIIGAIIFAFWTAFVSEVVVLEKKFYGQAIERSKFLIGNGQWVRVFVMVFLMMIFVWILGAIVHAGVNMVYPTTVHSMESVVVQLVEQVIVQAVFSPLYVVSGIVLYYDIRVRKEAFDLQMLADHLGTELPVWADTADSNYTPPGAWQANTSDSTYTPPGWSAPAATPAPTATPAAPAPVAQSPPSPPTQTPVPIPQPTLLPQAPPQPTAGGYPAATFCIFCGSPITPGGKVCPSCNQTQPTA